MARILAGATKWLAPWDYTATLAGSRKLLDKSWLVERNQGEAASAQGEAALGSGPFDANCATCIERQRQAVLERAFDFYGTPRDPEGGFGWYGDDRCVLDHDVHLLRPSRAWIDTRLPRADVDVSVEADPQDRPLRPPPEHLRVVQLNRPALYPGRPATSRHPPSMPQDVRPRRLVRTNSVLTTLSGALPARVLAQCPALPPQDTGACPPVPPKRVRTDTERGQPGRGPRNAAEFRAEW